MNKGTVLFRGYERSLSCLILGDNVLWLERIRSVTPRLLKYTITGTRQESSTHIYEENTPCVYTLSLNTENYS